MSDATPPKRRAPPPPDPAKLAKELRFDEGNLFAAVLALQYALQQGVIDMVTIARVPGGQLVCDLCKADSNGTPQRVSRFTGDVDRALTSLGINLHQQFVLDHQNSLGHEHYTNSQKVHQALRDRVEEKTKIIVKPKLN
jgi:hypothetical protein